MAPTLNKPVLLLLAIILIAFFTFTNFSRDSGATGGSSSSSASSSSSSSSDHTSRRNGLPITVKHEDEKPREQKEHERQRKHAKDETAADDADRPPPVTASPPQNPAAAEDAAAPTAGEFSPAPQLDAPLLFGSANAVERLREDCCATPNDDDKRQEEAGDAPIAIDGGGSGGQAENQSPSSNYFNLPSCPRFKLITNDSTDQESMDRRTSWVLSKYRMYARRCRHRDGIMWAKLTLANFKEIVRRVLKVIAPPSAKSDSRRREPFVIHDWGCGCGVGLDILSGMLARPESKYRSAIGHRKFYGFGVDLIEEAVMYAKNDVFTYADLLARGQLKFCQADGTDLSFIPSNSVDAVVAFGALLHLTKTTTCSTVGQLLRILKPGGTIWGGYIDDMSQVARLSECSFMCNPAVGMKAELTVVREDVWLKGLMPKSNSRRKPRSVIWRKLSTS